jgi:hypothetical protein
LLSPAIYHYGFRAFAGRGYQGKIWRVFFLTAVFVAALIVLALPGPSLQILRIGPVLAPSGDTLPAYHRDASTLARVALVTFTTLIPSMIYILSLVIDTILWMIWAVGTFVAYFLLFHSSHPTEQIKRLLVDEIPRSHGSRIPWRLLELDGVELDAIQKWAEANREGTEKRLLPTIVLFSLLQFFGWNAVSRTMFWQWLSETWSKVGGFLSGNQAFPLGILAFATLGILVGIMLIPVVAIGQLFSNLLPQSLIIEACIVARYAHQREEARSLQGTTRSPVPSRFLDRLAFLFGYVPRDQ